MKPWWFSNSRRLRQERDAIAGLAAAEPWFRLTAWEIHEFRFSLRGEIVAHGIAYPIRLIYPDSFPVVPAWVEPQDKTAKWSNHQYGAGGALCLELRPDNWEPTATGVDVLRSAYNLLDKENPLGEGEKGRVASAGHLTEVQLYKWFGAPVLLGTGCSARLQNGDASEAKAFVTLTAETLKPIFVSDALDRQRPQRPPSTDFYKLRYEIPVIVSAAIPPESVVTDRVAFLDVFSPGVGAGVSVPTDSMLAVMTGGPAPVAYYVPSNGEVQLRAWHALPDDAGARSGRSESAADKRVTIVGVGSVGAKIAECLLRSGINQLVLVDGDIFLPGNLERHVLTWNDVGQRKAIALRSKLLEIVPGADIRVDENNLNWQASAKSHADRISLIEASAVIVDATAHDATQLMLGALAAEHDISFVTATVFEGGLGALVARAVPGIDPTYSKGRVAFNAWCELQTEPVPKSGKARYEALAGDGTPFVADDAAVTATAGHAARVILDIVDGCPDDSGWLLFGYRRGWVFTAGHGHTLRINVGQYAAVEADETDEEMDAFVLQLAKDLLSAFEDTK